MKLRSAGFLAMSKRKLPISRVDLSLYWSLALALAMLQIHIYSVFRLPGRNSELNVFVISTLMQRLQAGTQRLQHTERIHLMLCHTPQRKHRK
jgi:hypothetical protein